MKNKINKSFISNQNGLAFIEFALLAPLLLVLFFGVIEITRYIIIFEKVERAAFSLTSIVGRYTPATAAALPAEINVNEINNNVFPQLARGMSPYSAAGDMGTVISSVTKVDAAGKHRGINYGVGAKIVDWQIVGGGTLSNADTVSIVSNLNVSAITPAVQNTPAVFDAAINADLATMLPEENMLVVEVFYQYRPIVADILTNLGAPTFADTTLVARIYSRPRNGDLITLPPTFN